VLARHPPPPPLFSMLVMYKVVWALCGHVKRCGKSTVDVGSKLPVHLDGRTLASPYLRS
jgi:hypothetical protein